MWRNVILTDEALGPRRKSRSAHRAPDMVSLAHGIGWRRPELHTSRFKCLEGGDSGVLCSGSKDSRGGRGEIMKGTRKIEEVRLRMADSRVHEHRTMAEGLNDSGGNQTRT